uniref:RNA-directed DNA polymerase, eukaryota, reverse transcriptase zinc-binding domain protein n=1 Tax=Tanacetum cinerariifolium TaxID=118510 RepID=A0A699IKB0_TANCI|nr:RNA-directed DNA polymerase, eukaryota, reverse transcriptase zinc-binding domain protein [Tanacetum cinerariifolium]
MSRIQSWHDVTEGMHTRSYEGASIYGIYSCAFFNGSDVNSKKPSWVRWKSVLAAKDVGGLGVSSLFTLNRGLMFKWVWRFFSQKNSLWVRVVKALHGEDGKIGKKVQPRYPSIWFNIINEIKSLKLHGSDLDSFITPKLGNGANTSFWDVAWCGDIAFKNLVSRLYALESMKNIEVASKLSHGGLEFSFRRNSRGGVEQAQFERLKEMVEGVTLRNSNDIWSWSLVGSGNFSVSSVRKLIDNAILPKGISKTRWIKEVPIKINVHAWKVIHDCLPTRFNISQRVYELVMEKDFVIVKGKKDKYKYIALKVKMKSSDDEASTLGCEDEEYAMVVRDFKKFFRPRGNFIRQPRDEKKSIQKPQDDKTGKKSKKSF